MSIAGDEAMELFRAEHQYDLREAYVRGREAEPAAAEIEAVARRLLWRSCEWDGIDATMRRRTRKTLGIMPVKSSAGRKASSSVRVTCSKPHGRR